MNPLEENANLFANGEFEFIDEQGERKRIDGYYNNRFMFAVAGEGVSYHYVKNCTLIARPIEDMTNKEFFSVQEDMSVLDLLQKEEFIKVLSEQTETKDGLGLRWVKCLGDWGMYFGPQSHFKDETVIDSRTI